MNEICVAFQDLEEDPRGPEITAYCRKVLTYLGIDNWELSIVFCSNAFIQSLNKTYRGLDRPTDVLAFPQDGRTAGDAGPTERLTTAGDIVISIPKAGEAALALKIPVLEEIHRLLVHGILHLKGMDHKHKEEKMLELQEEILSKVDKEY